MALCFLFLFMLAYNDCVLGERNIIVADNLLNSKDLKDIRSKLGDEEVVWSFHNLASTPASEIRNDSRGNYAFPTSHYWMTRLIPSDFTQGDLKEVWGKLSQEVAVHFGVKSDQLHVLRVGAQISARGDDVKPTNPCTTQQGDVNVIIVVIVIPKWDKNSYGEVVVYDDKGEILKSIHPFNGRAVILPCGYNFVIKPPSMNCKERLRTLMIHVSSSSATSQLTVEDHKAYMKDKSTLHGLYALPASPENFSKFNVEDFVTRQFQTSKGHPIITFDNLIPFEIIDGLAETMNNGIYFDNPPSPDSTDNVQWILAFDVEHIVGSSLWPCVQAIVNYASKKEGYYPYDVSCNSIRSHDSTTIHLDCNEDQDEYTLLIYLNKNWTVNDQGETLFFDYDRKEMVHAVRPKYGRVVIFQGTIPHSARPPSPTIHAPRFTLAIKFAVSKEEAFAKTMNLETEPIAEYISNFGPDEAAEKAYKDIMAGKKSPQEIEKIVREYEKKLKNLSS